MTTNLSRYKSDLDKLTKLGKAMNLDLSLRNREEAQDADLDENDKKDAKQLRGIFEQQYQMWYTESCAVVRQLLPDRFTEFEQLYKGDGKPHKADLAVYNIQDWLRGVRSAINDYTLKKYFDDLAAVSMRFSVQLRILEAVETRLESSLFDIAQVVQADLFDSELDVARELAKHGFLRAAGAVGGVVLEKHLAQVAANHDIKTRKQHPSISDLNDLLKNGSVLDIPVWRNIQRLGDLRNLCVHDNDREPTSDEINELLDGADKITKTLF